ncbi:glyoxal reductase-like isoform X2 [Lytechinus variegatus]|uniref:glyoxal reductase-like isoform X2 n=1 Tax=Lytechinus variegatus TaxID=7654 RepID=UPI001BB1E7BB|nr:glyoxal reductase-like isoform X2 [Lytechinus variegatus]
MTKLPIFGRKCGIIGFSALSYQSHRPRHPTHPSPSRTGKRGVKHRLVPSDVGTYCMRGTDTVYKCLDTALKHGYRLIDTAAVYRNEEDIGNALKELLPKYGLERSDIYITSKLAPADQGEKAYDACLLSLQKLQMEYLDLYLIHWPGTQKLKPHDPKNTENRQVTWKVLERLHREGKCKQIGISNYLVKHMEELMKYAEIQPAVNQLLNHPSVVSIADRIQRKPCQVLLKWAMQDGIGVIPMSTKPDHIIDNCDVFDWSLSDEDMIALHSFNETKKCAWDPVDII